METLGIDSKIIEILIDIYISIGCTNFNNITNERFKEIFSKFPSSQKWKPILKEPTMTL